MAQQIDLATANWIGARVREARRSKGWAQAVLAERAGLSRETICRLEQGRDAYVATVQQIAKALDLNPRDLLPPSTPRRILPTAIGSALRQRRTSQGLTLIECATEAGLSASALSRLEHDLGRHEKMRARLRDRRDPWLRNRAYAKTLGFITAADLRDWCRERLEESVRPPPASPSPPKRVDPDQPFWVTDRLAKAAQKAKEG